jgi:transcription elongation GreA/GreB family factor
VGTAEELNSKTPAEAEERFLAMLSADTLPLDGALAALREAAGRDAAQAESWAELLRDALRQRKDSEGLARLLPLWATWRNDEAFHRLCREALVAAFSDRQNAAFVRCCGFDRGAPAAECLRRFDLLRRLNGGTLCRDRTWGFGVVRGVDPFYEKVTVDFAGKPGHSMSFAYAAEVLELLGEDHLLARKHRDAGGLLALAERDPAEIVRIALRSFGSINVHRLREILEQEGLAVGGWKPFWERARKALKEDQFVEIPALRSAPLRLLEKPRGFDDAWFAALGAETDIERVLALVRQMEQAGEGAALTPQRLDLVGARLGFVILGARGARPDLLAKAVMTARRIGAPPARVDVAAATSLLMAPETFLEAVSALPSRDVAALLGHLARHDGPGTEKLTASLLLRLPATVLEEVVALLTERGREEDCVGAIGAALRGRSASAELLVWACRRHELCGRWGVGGPAELVNQAIDVLEGPRRDDKLRTLNQIRGLFEDRDWLAAVLGGMTAEGREALYRRILACRGWDEAQRRSVLARLVKLYPELREAGARHARQEEEEVGGRGRPARTTSWRTHRQRQEQLRELIETLIPANSREIGQARGYGDLSENFEYQAAKDQQKILMQRQREWERDLREVRGTDFSKMPSDTAGVGTCVTVEGPDGARRRYCILGEWDSDERLGIISSLSAVAGALDGCRAGEHVVLPSESGGQTCRIVEVSALPDEVRAWAAGPG